MQRIPIYQKESFLRGEGFGILLYHERNRDTYHTHEFIELCYVLGGNGIHRLGNAEAKVSKGDFFIINTDTAHTFIQTGDVPLMTWNILFTPDFLDTNLLPLDPFGSLPESYLFKGLDDLRDVRADVRIPPEDRDRFESLFRAMEEEYTKKQTGFQSILRAYLIELIVLVLRRLEQGNDEDADTENDRIIRKTLEYFRNNYDRDLNLSEIARNAMFSKNYFCTLFKEKTGKTVFACINEIRAEHAMKLLKETDLSLTDISYRAGFRDYRAFLRAFELRFDCTPSEIRRTKK